jgi:hypothetical protein
MCALRCNPMRSHETVAQADTDDAGIYRFPAVPPGEYVLKLQAAGFAQLTVRSIAIADQERRVLPPITITVSDPACGGRGVVVSLRPSSSDSQFGSLHGTVRVYERRRVGKSVPVPSAGVTLLCADGVPCGTTNTDSRGNFVFSGVNAGTFRVRVHHEGFYSLDESGYTVQGGYEAFYLPIDIERCKRRDCDPLRRPKRPPAQCE